MACVKASSRAPLYGVLSTSGRRSCHSLISISSIARSFAFVPRAIWRLQDWRKTPVALPYSPFRVGSTMESSDDLGDMTEFWEAELDEDGARKDRMPPPLPMSTENMRLISLSRKSILVGLVKKIPAGDPVFDTWYRYGGFFSHVRVDVPDSADATKFREEFSSSFQEFSTAEAAEEKAAENMIRTLEATCKFEVKDLNWEMRRRFHVDSFDSCTGWRAAKDEICALKMKMEEMKKGWRSTLEGVDRWCDHIRSCGVGYAEDAFPFVLQEGVTKFESVCEEKYNSV